MNETALELIKIIKSTQSFVADQAPDVARQMLLRGAFDAWMYLGLGLLFFGIVVVILFLVYREYKKSDDIYDIRGGSILALMLLIVTVVLACSNVSTLYKIKYAPKVYLLEELSDLVRSEK